MFAVNHISERHPPAPLLNRPAKRKTRFFQLFWQRALTAYTRTEDSPINNRMAVAGTRKRPGDGAHDPVYGQIVHCAPGGRNHIKWPAQLFIQQPENTVTISSI